MQKAPSAAHGPRHPASDNIKWQWASCISYMFLAVNKDVHKTATNDKTWSWYESSRNADSVLDLGFDIWEAQVLGLDNEAYILGLGMKAKFMALDSEIYPC